MKAELWRDTNARTVKEVLVAARSTRGLIEHEAVPGRFTAIDAKRNDATVSKAHHAASQRRVVIEPSESRGTSSTSFVRQEQIVLPKEFRTDVSPTVLEVHLQ